jgi:hypothetical protein
VLLGDKQTVPLGYWVYIHEGKTYFILEYDGCRNLSFDNLAEYTVLGTTHENRPVQRG